MDDTKNKDKQEKTTGNIEAASEPDSRKNDEAEIDKIFSEISPDTKSNEADSYRKPEENTTETVQKEDTKTAVDVSDEKTLEKTGKSAKETITEESGEQDKEAPAVTVDEGTSQTKEDQPVAPEKDKQKPVPKETTLEKEAAPPEEKTTPIETKKRFWVNWVKYIQKYLLDTTVKKTAFIGAGSILIGIFFVLAIGIIQSSKQSESPQKPLQEYTPQNYQPTPDVYDVQKDSSPKKQVPDHKMLKRINQYNKQYWVKIKSQYLKCGNISSAVLDQRWSKLTEKYPNVLDTVELLIWEEIEYFGSEINHGTGCIIVSDRIVIEGTKRIIREITSDNWESLGLNKIAEIPDEDWLYFRCKVFRDLSSTALFNNMSQVQYENHKKRFLSKLNAEKVRSVLKGHSTIIQ